MYGESQIIPTYSFTPQTASGNQMFRIDRTGGTVNYNLSDFLIPHRKGYYFMAFVKQGNSRHWIDMTPYILKPNTFYFTTPHQVHLKEEAAPLTGIILSFTNDFLVSDNEGVLKTLPIIQNPYNGHELSLHTQDQLFVEDILEKILAEYDSRTTWQHTMLLSYMKVLLVHLSRLYIQQFNDKEHTSERLLLKKYLARIDQSYTQHHEVGDYAEMLNISAGHLSEVVKEQSGKPAITHIHERLSLEAKRLLFHTDHSIKEIAFHLGFEDASYFNRFFKRLTGFTPLHFRDNFREMYHGIR